jgi:hypothetical protein
MMLVNIPIGSLDMQLHMAHPFLLIYTYFGIKKIWPRQAIGLSGTNYFDRMPKGTYNIPERKLLPLPNKM